MAICKSAEKKIKNEAGMLNVIEYIANPEKASLTTTVNCYGKSDEILNQFLLTQSLQKRKQKAEDNILVHHYIQSFCPEDNITPEQAHQLGIELMKKAAPNYQYVITTHIDKGHIHNHIVLNSVNPLTGYKWHDNKATDEHMRNINDELCRANNFNVLPAKSSHRGLDQTTYQMAVKGKSWKANLCNDLDDAIENCKSKMEFIDYLNKRGYSVRYKDVHITITKNGEKKGIRVDTLASQFGEKYKKENLEKAMGYHCGISAEFKKQREEFRAKKKTGKINYKTEWQRYEEWYFREEKYKPKKFKNIGSLPTVVLNTNRIDVFLLKLILYILLYSFLKCKSSAASAERAKEKKYKIEPREKSKSQSKEKTIPLPKAVGNIARTELLAADGENFYATIDTLQLLKLSEADFFFTSKINISKKAAYITIKEENRHRLSAIIGIPVAELEQKNTEFKNRMIYADLKKLATKNGEKLEFKIIDAEKLERLKAQRIKFAAFDKENGRINIAYLPSDAAAVNEINYTKTAEIKK